MKGRLRETKSKQLDATVAKRAQQGIYTIWMENSWAKKFLQTEM